MSKLSTDEMSTTDMGLLGKTTAPPMAMATGTTTYVLDEGTLSESCDEEFDLKMTPFCMLDSMEDFGGAGFTLSARKERKEGLDPVRGDSEDEGNVRVCEYTRESLSFERLQEEAMEAQREAFQWGEATPMDFMKGDDLDTEETDYPLWGASFAFPAKLGPFPKQCETCEFVFQIDSVHAGAESSNRSRAPLAGNAGIALRRKSWPPI